MSATDIWPFQIEVNIVQRNPPRERTLFVTIKEDGWMGWMDHSGRMGHAGVGAVWFRDGREEHWRGDQKLTPKQVESEKQEFGIEVRLEPSEFQPIRDFIIHVGKPWLAGWEMNDSSRLHEMLEAIYWKHVNQFVYRPFDEPKT